MKEVNYSNVKEIIQQLNEATKAYDKGHPIMSDKQWDDLYFALDKFEKQTGILYPNSPTQTIQVYTTASSLKKVTHSHPMLSLAKTKSLDEIERFIGNHDYVAMAKMDGLTCSLTYTNGELTGAETRGDGIIGEDVYDNVRHIKNVPIHIPTDKPIVVIDGEVICTYKDFEPFKNDYRNPRNFASGSIRLLDSSESAKRNLSFIAWDGIAGFDEETLTGKLETIVLKYGFEGVPWIKENPQYAITDIQDYCQSHSYPIDGVVFKYDNCAEYDLAGHTEHHFKGGIAFKFYDDLYETSLLDIEWSMGKTGVLTPIAVFEPIDVDGSVVERASLHNVSLLQEMFNGVPFKHQPMRIYKANQIIPQVYDATGSATDAPADDIISFPDFCPCCGEPLSYRYEGVSEYCFCDNKACSGRLINRLEHFFGKKGLDIKGLSEATFEKLIDWGWVNSIEDVFKLTQYKDEWIQKPGFGEKSVNNILNAIESGKTCEMSKFIAGLGIPLVGSSYAKVIAQKIRTYDEFKDAVKSNFNFMQWDGFGPQVSDSLLHFDYTEADSLYVNCLEIGNSLYKSQASTLSDTLKDQIFVITGRLNTYKNRDALVTDIEAHGGKVVNSISKNTSYLINNDITSNSAKNVAAKKLKIPIITEETFKQLMNGEILYIGTASTVELTCMMPA